MVQNPSVKPVHRIVLLGPPASGKGTQGRLMAERWGVSVVSAGDVLRDEIARNTPLGQEAARYMTDGGLVPDRLALASVEGWLAEHGDDFVFDGFPRTVGQADLLQAILVRRGTPLSAVLWLDLDLMVIEQRVSRRVVCADCGRSFQVGMHVAERNEICPVCGGTLTTRTDDSPDRLATRMQAYRDSTAPLIEYYAERSLLQRIDANRAPEEVFAQIEEVTHATAEEAAA